RTVAETWEARGVDDHWLSRAGRGGDHEPALALYDAGEVAEAVHLGRADVAVAERHDLKRSLRGRGRQGDERVGGRVGHDDDAREAEHWRHLRERGGERLLGEPGRQAVVGVAAVTLSTYRVIGAMVFWRFCPSTVRGVR